MSRSGYLGRDAFATLLAELNTEGFRCIGPTIRDDAIVFDDLTSIDALPQGQGLDLKPGHVRLTSDNHSRYFAWPNGPQGIKPWLYQSRELLWSARPTDDGFVFSEPTIDQQPIAYIGARACDLAALKLQDKHFMKGEYPDPYYSAYRKALFIVAVNCSHNGATCFCASTNDGPKVQDGYDLLLDELDDGFLVRFGSEKGLQVFERLPLQETTSEHEAQAKIQLANVVAEQQRELLPENMRKDIFACLDANEWHQLVEKCLACGNCTAVCPTCFCHREVEVAALDGNSSEHFREWDSCFNQDHSYIHGLTVREQTRQRYRQWMTHKLGSWHDQYGRSGCTGCGRCIAWCPAGIDFVAEANLVMGDF